MTNLYDYVLSNEDAQVFAAVLEYDEDTCANRIISIETQPERDEDDDRELESRYNEQRVLNLLLKQHEDQVANGPAVSFEIRYDLTEPLQNALVSQVAYATRQRDGYARLVAAVPDNQDIRDAYNGYRRQVLALEEVIKQVGKHV